MEKPKEILELEKQWKVKFTYLNIEEFRQEFKRFTNKKRNLFTVNINKEVTGIISNFSGISGIRSISKLTSLTSLDLRSNQISNISSISKLTSLTSLYLSSNQISDISSISKLTSLTSLYLSSNQISDISSISKLTSLTYLSLSYNKISDISPIYNLTLLTYLDLNSNMISYFRSTAKLSSLTFLDLSSNLISHISLSKLTSLTSLNLSSNQILTISLSDLTLLTNLNLSSSQISDINIVNLTSLTSLDLSSNLISDFNIFNLPLLTSLNLSSNQISDISFLSNLTSLTYLSLSSNKILDISPIYNLALLTYLDLNSNMISYFRSTAKLSSLTFLDLSSNLISDFNIFNLPLLTSLNLSSNQISDISSISKITSLTYLSLSYNKISDISPIYNLTLLTYLDLNSNMISYFPPKILTKLINLELLKLYKNSIKNISKEIYDIDTNIFIDVKNHLESLEKDKEKAYLQEGKMILIGNGEVGKSSIRLKLLDRNAILPTKSERTQGLDIAIETYKVKKLEQEKTGLISIIDFQLHIWDFGGQGKYREVQQLFCSRKSLYLFVTSFDDKPDKEDYVGFDYWLSMANAFNFDEDSKKYSPVIHVVNKIDEKPTYINEEIRIKVFSNIYPDFIKISCITLENFDSLEKVIREALPSVSEDIFTTSFPQTWLNIKDKLQKNSKNHINYTEYISICKNEKVDESNAATLIKVLDRMGYVIYYGRNPRLRDWIILNPLWVKNAIYQALDSEIITEAKFLPKQFPLVWKTFQSTKNWFERIAEKITLRDYTAEEHSKLIDLMLAYEFCYEQKDNHKNIYYIIPTLLSPIKPSVPEYLESFEYELKFTYDPFIPAGTLNKLIVRLHEHIYNNLKWKNGVILHDTLNNAYAEITERWEEKTVYLKLKKGNNVQPLYQLIFKTLKDLNEHLKETKFLARLEFFTFFKNQDKWYEPSQIQDLKKAKDFEFIEQTESLYNQNNNPKLSIPPMSTLNFTKDENYKDLVKAIQENKVVLFAGTGVSAYSTNGNPLSMWKGLLENGIEYCKECSIDGCNDEWVADKKRALNRNKLSEWLLVAESITDELIVNKHFKTWLKKSVGSLTIQKPDLIEAIKELACPVFTTNYDNLLEIGLVRKPIHNLQADKIQELLNNERQGIVYLHGYFDDADSVILGIRSYEQLANKAFFQALQQAITLTKHILFVGYGAGMDDPNFGKLLAWSKQNVTGEHHHYRLVLEKDKIIDSGDNKIQNIVYSNRDKYDDIVSFFQELNNDVKP